MKIQYNRFKADNYQYMTQSLFYEYRNVTGSEYYPFTMKEEDCNGCISVYRVYMESDTEYDCAKKLLNSWKHWKVLSEAPFFKKELELWREERAVREAAYGVKTLIEAAKDGNVNAAKYLLDKNTSKKPTGRPTRTQIIEEKRKQARIDGKVTSIIDRMSKYDK